MQPLPPFGRRGYLPPGWHQATETTFRQRCVEEMPYFLGDGTVESPERAKMFNGYMKLREAISQMGIPTEQWVGGSYATSAEDPKDIDVVNFCDAHAFESLPAELRVLVRKYFRGRETVELCHCDSYFVSKGPPHHPCNDDYLIKFNYWKKLLGHDKRGVAKGLIGLTIELPHPPEQDDA